jgi:hypothetical protein
MGHTLDLAADNAPVEHAYSHDLVERCIRLGRSQTHCQGAFDTSIGKSAIDERWHRSVHRNLTAGQALTEITLVLHDFDCSSKFLPVR